MLIKIKDNGDGIPKNVQMKIFEMFFRGSEKSQGNGLGLFLVKRPVEILNGTIKIKSTLKGGTEFSVTLPVKAQYTSHYEPIVRKKEILQGFF